MTRVVLSTSRILGVKDLGAEMELQLPLEVASEFPPEIFARHRHRHFENLVSRKMQSLCNPKFFYCPSVSLPCLSKYQSLPHHTTPAPPLSLKALLSSVRACACNVYGQIHQSTQPLYLHFHSPAMTDSNQIRDYWLFCFNVKYQV